MRQQIQHTADLLDSIYQMRLATRRAKSKKRREAMTQKLNLTCKRFCIARQELLAGIEIHKQDGTFIPDLLDGAELNLLRVIVAEVTP